MSNENDKNPEVIEDQKNVEINVKKSEDSLDNMVQGVYINDKEYTSEDYMNKINSMEKMNSFHYADNQKEQVNNLINIVSKAYNFSDLIDLGVKNQDKALAKVELSVFEKIRYYTSFGKERENIYRSFVLKHRDDFSPKQLVSMILENEIKFLDSKYDKCTQIGENIRDNIHGVSSDLKKSIENVELYRVTFGKLNEEIKLLHERKEAVNKSNNYLKMNEIAINLIEKNNYMTELKTKLKIEQSKLKRYKNSMANLQRKYESNYQVLSKIDEVRYNFSDMAYTINSYEEDQVNVFEDKDKSQLYKNLKNLSNMVQNSDLKSSLRKDPLDKLNNIIYDDNDFVREVNVSQEDKAQEVESILNSCYDIIKS